MVYAHPQQQNDQRRRRRRQCVQNSVYLIYFHLHFDWTTCRFVCTNSSSVSFSVCFLSAACRSMCITTHIDMKNLYSIFIDSIFFFFIRRFSCNGNVRSHYMRNSTYNEESCNSCLSGSFECGRCQVTVSIR